MALNRGPRVDVTLTRPYYSVTPNCRETSNNMATPKSHARPAIERTLEAFEAFQQRMMTAHAPEFASLDITMSQAKLLYVVTAAGELTMSDIAGRLGVTVSTASGSVDHLVALGYLARVDDPANRRQVQVSVTPAGFAHLEQIRELGTRQLRDLFETLTDDELRVIRQATELMTRAVAARNPHGSTK
jgi:DNA-binding MarR family transcriptional regulator